MPGPAPSERKHGHTPNRSSDWREIDDVPFTAAPAMPDPPGRKRKWHLVVEAWWKTTSTMPHCALWRPEDWQQVYELMYEKERYYSSGEDDKTTAQLTEIRRREDALGIGDAARSKLRIRYKQKTEPGAVGDGPDGAQTVLDEAPVQAAVPGGSVVPIGVRRESIRKRAQAQGQGQSGSPVAGQSDSQTA